MKLTILGKKHSIARRLLLAVILMSSAMTILTSAYQLNGNYQRYVNEIKVRFDEIEKIHVKTLTRRLWTADIDALKNNLKEISILPDIGYMEIKENNSILSSIGSKKDSDTITKTFPMTFNHKGKDITIGMLTVQATLDNAFKQVKEQILDILISNAIKTFFLAGFILFIFNHLITRHLNTMANFAEKLNVTDLDKKLILDRKKQTLHHPDELEIVVNAFTTMQKNLYASIEKLQQSESHYRQLVESTTAIPWEYDVSSEKFTYVGPQAITILGYPINDWYSTNFIENHIHADDKEFIISLRKQCVTHSKDYIHEYRMITADGRIIWVRDDVKLIKNNPELAYLQGNMFDITERKLNEIELDKHRNNLEKLIQERTNELVVINKELEAFSYSVSHDLRAPLRSIDGFSHILIEDKADILDKTSLEYLHRIRKSAQVMGQIINDLLLLSRVTRHELKLTLTNLTSIAQDAVSRLNITKENNVRVIIEQELFTNADEHLVPIIMDNLIGNAWKYTSKTPNPTIEIGQTLINNKSYFFVKDNGIGFNMEFVDKIFEPFQRLHSAKTFEGTGIGLANVLRAIQRHGGEIFVESIPNKGATFYFSLK